MTQHRDDAQVQRELDEAPARYYADVPNRVVALMVDALLLTLLIFVGTVIVALLVGPAVQFDPAADSLEDAVTIQRGVAALDAALSVGLSAAYFAGTWTLLGASPGQRWLGMTVVDVHGERVGATRALLRWLLLGAPLGVGAFVTTALPHAWVALAVNAALLVWYLTLLVTTATSPTKQGLHDRFAGTVVAKEGRPVSWSRMAADAR